MFNEFRNKLLSYFFSNKDTSYKNRTIENEDYLILFKNESVANQYDILITIAELIAKVNTEAGNQFEYLILSDTDPEPLDNPAAGTLLFGQYNNILWTKNSSGVIDYILSDILEVVASVDNTTIFDFAPNVIPNSSLVSINGAIIASGYTISGTTVVTDVGQDERTVMRVFRTITRQLT